MPSIEEWQTTELSKRKRTKRTNNVLQIKALHRKQKHRVTFTPRKTGRKLRHINTQWPTGYTNISKNVKGPSWLWSHGSWIYNYLCNRCLSSLTLWVRIPSRRGVLDTTLCDEACQWLAAGRWFYPGTPVSSTNKTYRHDINRLLLTVALNITTLT